MPHLPPELRDLISSYLELKHEFLDFDQNEYDRTMEKLDQNLEAEVQETQQKRRPSLVGARGIKGPTGAPGIGQDPVERVSILCVKDHGSEFALKLHFYYHWTPFNYPRAHSIASLAEFMVSVGTNVSDKLLLGRGLCLYYLASKDDRPAQFLYQHVRLTGRVLPTVVKWLQHVQSLVPTGYTLHIIY